MRTGKSRAIVGVLAVVVSLVLAARRPGAAEQPTSSDAAAKAPARLVELDVVAAPRAGTSFGIGDRVELLIGDIWYPGVIYAAQGAQYSINRDNYGRTRWTPGDIRRELKPQTLRPMAGRSGEGPFLNGERVLVTTGGSSHRGNIGVHEPGTDVYLVDRYNENGVAAQGVPVATAQIRRLEAVPAPTGPAVSFPPNLMSGTYLCTIFEGTTTTTIGRLRILGPATYTGITPDGSGPPRRYAYDPATGSIEWIGGVANLKVIMEHSDYRLANDGSAEITLYYKVAADRFNLAMTCARRGA
jgi:hypothetical protein